LLWFEFGAHENADLEHEPRTATTNHQCRSECIHGVLDVVRGKVRLAARGYGRLA
jgi:hypothetical protein